MVVLNDQQLKVVNACGPIFVQAGPGTGKTSTIAERVAKEVRKPGARPYLILTFTRAGVDSFTRKVNSRLSGMSPLPQTEYSLISTIDSFINRFFVAPALCEAYPDRTYDFIPSYEVDKEGWLEIPGIKNKVSLEVFEVDGAYIGASKNYRNASGVDSLREKVSESYRKFFDSRIVSSKLSREIFACLVDDRDGALTPDWFDPKIVSSAHVERRFADLVQRFPTVYVDEGQDCSEADLLLIEGLERHGSEVSYIGDSNQEIYQFRGAVGFRNRTRNRSQLSLTSSYRATDPICKFLETIYATGLQPAECQIGAELVSVMTFTNSGEYERQLRGLNATGAWTVLSHSKSGLAKGLSKPEPYGQQSDPLFDVVEVIGSYDGGSFDTKRVLMKTIDLLETCENRAELIEAAEHRLQGSMGQNVTEVLGRHVAAALLSRRQEVTATSSTRESVSSIFQEVVFDLLHLLPVIPEIPELSPWGSPSYPRRQWEQGVSRNQFFDTVNSGTIHSAKGLEFENVSVVVDSWHPGEDDHILDALLCDPSDPAVREILNVFYVGCSRAQKRLNVSFHLGSDYVVAEKRRAQIMKKWGHCDFVSLLTSEP
ncbi:hypothetical protein CYJ46_01800 [Corynebacterium coyleae]|uniref:ATP-dependent helicase n=1 Tax=Corynebacterium coyleae TaxID=53374 RepID=UPI000C77DA9A|nr:ATP-dependent helicase [Corynebacterium coyleae]PLA39066.1 hypothetical protein CYJ46_01800 [Corynebacterium coyleae]